MSKKTNFIILTTILFIAFTLLNAEVQNQPENPYKISFLGNIRNDRVIGSIIWGDSYLFDDDIMAEEIIALHDEWIVVAYNDDSAPNYGKARCRLGEVNGTEINWGSEKTFADYCYIHFSIAPITGNKFVVAYLEGTYLYVRIGEGDGVDDIDFYDIHEIGYNANSRPVKIKHLSETKYVVVNGDKATIVTADLYSNTLSNGSSYAFVSNETNQLSLSVLSSTKFVVFYQNYPSDNDGYARVGTVSGTSITFGNTVAFNTTGETEYIESAGLNSGKVVVTYSRHTSNGPCVVKIGNISGTNITFSEEHIYNNNNSNRLGITRLSDSKFIVSYCPSYAYAKSKIGEISGSDITWSEESSGLVNIRRDPSFAVMNDTKIVLIGESFYYNDGYSYIGTIVYPMEFIDHDADQVTDETLAGKQDQHIQRVEFETDGDYNPLILAQLGGDTNGTTDYDNDIDRIKVYYTGLDDTFSPIDQFGSTIENPDYNWNFYGSQELAEGINYFWICYDINETADAGNYLDVRTLDFTLEGEIQQNFSGGDPSGHREIIGFDRLPGNMLELDGIDDYVSVPLVLPDNGTIELWYYPDSLYNYNTIFDNSLDANDWEMWIYETGELKFRIENDGFVSYDLNNLFGAEHWYHIALSWNKHDALVDYNLYINGDLKDSETDKTWLDPGVQFYLGGGNAGNTNGKGIIDEIQIWKISKTAEQIRESIHKGNNGWTDGLIAKWQFNDSSGNTVTDLVNDYEATLNNMTDDDWITSNIPFGKGYSNSRTEQSGLVDFGSSNLDMDYTTHNSAEITATMINLSPNTLPSVDEVYDNQYWVVNRYGTGSFDADMIFEPSENIDSWMEANPDYLKLFTRTGNAIDEWIHLVNASSAEASSNKVTFDNITDLSQFIICGINFPEISSTIPDDDETDTDWSSRVYIEFDKDIFAGTGNLILKKASNDSTVATVSASSVTINGSSVEIDFGTQLEQSTSYYIQIDNDAFIDDYNIYFSGIDDNTTWNFTTGAVEVIPGTGVEFDGIDDYENVGSHSSLDISGGITIECWVKPQAHSDWARIIAAPSSFNGKYVLSLGDDEGEFAFAYQEGVGTQRASISFQPYLTMNEWNHITCTSDGTQNGNRLYVNGVQVFRSEADDFGFSGTDVWLGCKQNNTRAFNGCIDEMRIWNTIRTEEEIRQYMCLPLNGDEAGLVSYWQFNEGSGYVAKDWVSGNHANWRNPGRSGWIDSNIPFSSGTNVTLEFGETGTYDYSAAGVSLEITSFNPNWEDSLTVAITKLDNAPNTIPDSIDYVYDDQYWVFTESGGTFFNSNITFTINEDLTEDDESFPNTIALYKRTSGSEGGWNLYERANSVDAATNSATFENIDSFSQFIIAKNTNFPEPEGIAGNAIEFDGTDDYVEVSNESAFDFSNQFTVEFWMHIESVGDNWECFTLMTKGSDAWTIDLVIDGGYYNFFYFHIPYASGEITAMVDSTDIYYKWNHLSFVYDGTPFEDGFVSIYMNGVEIETGSAYGNVYDSPDPVIIGSDQDNFNNFPGKMDEVRIWRVARTEEEIRENMHKSLLGYESGLISNFQFNESSGITAADVINGNDGTLHNMDDEDWVDSTIPFGGGYADTQIVSTPGNIVFTDTDLLMNFTAITGTDTIVVSKLELAPNINPTEPDEVFDAQYWVVNRFGTGTFDADLTFTLSEDLTAEDEANPSQIKLYTRSSNADTNWVYLTDASSIDAATDEATFDGITEFSQFIIGRYIGTLDIPQNVTIEIIGANVQISWDAVNGANSYKIYTSDDPYAVDWGSAVDTVFAPNTTWTSPITEEKKFYYVVASTEVIRDYVPGVSRKSNDKKIRFQRKNKN